MGRDEMIRDMAVGALAGVAATWAMDRVTSLLYARESEEAREREDAAREGRTAYGVAAEKVAGLVGTDLSDDERTKYGARIHWALGAGAGAVYGALRHRLPAAAAGRGLAFGTAFWAVVDEGANTALGLTPGPAEFPWQTHARGLAGHLAFGLVADSVLGVADRITS